MGYIYAVKTNKVKIIIKSADQIKSEFLDSFENKKTNLQKENEIVFTDIKSFMDILTLRRLEILIYLNRFKPDSIYELARGLNRDFKNVHTDVHRLFDMNLIDLEPSGTSRNGLTPKAKYTGIELSLTA